MSNEIENKDEEGFDLIKNFHPNDIPNEEPKYEDEHQELVHRP